MSGGSGSGVAPKRRLPVLQSAPVDEDESDRPAWHWSALGVIASFLAWLPLASVAALIVKNGLLGGGSLESADRPRMAAIAAVHAAAFALATFGGGVFVGRFGGSAGRKEAAVSGLATACVAWLVTAYGGARSSPLFWGALLAVIAVIGSASAYAGGRGGLRLRARAAPKLG